MGAPQQGSSLPDPLRVHTNRDRPGHGLGLPDPLGLFADSAPPTQEMPAPTPPASVTPPTTADAQARVRQQQARDSADQVSRRRGRRSTILTSDEGVGNTPVVRRTLVGA